MTTVTITWRSVADEYPYAADTVLVSFDRPEPVDPDGREVMTWFGYCDGERWIDAGTGGPFCARVTHWAELPMGMTPAPTKVSDIVPLRDGTPVDLGARWKLPT